MPMSSLSRPLQLVSVSINKEDCLFVHSCLYFMLNHEWDFIAYALSCGSDL